jgi:hypothetical protein
MLTSYCQTQRKIMDGLEHRVGLATKDVQMIPALSHEISHAVADDRQTIVSAA